VLVEISDVLEEDVFRRMVIGDPEHLVEEIAPPGVVEPLLGSGLGKRLAWKTSTNDVVRRDVLDRGQSDVPGGAQAEVALVQILKTGIDLGSKHPAMA
jgi:hypothetical protein